MPTPITGVPGLVRYNSISEQYTMNDTTCTVSNADIFTTSGFAALPPNAAQSAGGLPSASLVLKTFLQTVFASDALAETAFRAIGGRIDCRQTAGTATSAPKIAWKGAAAVPTLQFDDVGSDNVFEVCIWVPISSIQ